MGEQVRYTVPLSDVARWTSATARCVAVEIVRGWPYGSAEDVAACAEWAVRHPDHGAPVRPVEV